jgi:hypothetical protein
LIISSLRNKPNPVCFVVKEADFFKVLFSLFNFSGTKFAALQKKFMLELIEKLKNEAGLTDKQAWQAITIVKDFAKSKFPMFGGAIEKAFTKHAKKEDEDFLD